MNQDRTEGSLCALSPLDGRYAAVAGALRAYFSEYALMKERVLIEVRYLLALGELPAFPLSLSTEEAAGLNLIGERFSLTDAEFIRRIEQEGEGGIGPTGHDVKAVEYYLRERLTELGLARLSPWIHIGLTSEDVDNLAYNRLILSAVHTVILPAITDIEQRLLLLAEEHKRLPMLGHTHCQPASPTTLGKEFAVYLHRLTDGVAHLGAIRLNGKLAGATGNLSAHRFAFPEVDWLGFAARFVSQLGLEPAIISTQVLSGDRLARLFFALIRINNVLLDLVVDMWLYISKGYLLTRPRRGAIGSSTMPHKTNPIDFENSEGNLTKANADLVFLSTALTRSRLQRDLSGSTIRRTIGTTFAYSLIGYRRALAGLNRVTVEEETISTDLHRHFEVLSEPLQTLLRRAGTADAYERVKEHLRAGALDKADFSELIAKTGDYAKDDPIARLCPADYIGFAVELAERVIAAARSENHRDKWVRPHNPSEGANR